ncbi:MAG: hypothetical protein M1837_001069 [Sclerophora amabilis]|nr:MAG: hypothetical protein M1837_001069 [Sclerophora amabilis]
MAKNKKRKQNPPTSEQHGRPYHKRPRPSAPDDDESGDLPKYGAAKPRIDAATGMRSAFPDLDGDDDDGELFYGPASDGLEYLRMVRSEARGVPDLLVAPKDTDDVDLGRGRGRGGDEEVDDYDPGGRGDGDADGGYYFDGAYTAAPDPETSGRVSGGRGRGREDEDGEPQDIYHTALLLRYRLLRANLRCWPPPEALAALDVDHPSYIPGNPKVTLWRWRRLLRTTDPLPAQVARMAPDTVFSLLKVLTTGFLRRNANISARTGRWLWALLGRVEDVGCLVSGDVGVVRELGKKAVWVAVGARMKAAAEEESEELELELEPDDDEDVQVVEEDANDEPPIESNSNGAAGTETLHTTSSGNEITDGNNAADSPLQDPIEAEEGEVLSNASDPDSGSVHHPPPQDQSSMEDIEAIKTRLLAQLQSSSDAKDPSHQNLPPTPPDSHTIRAQDIDHQTARDQDDKDVDVGDPNHSHGDEGIKEEGEEHQPFPSQSTLATLNMIITIVGECYGQRDLLEFRELWDDEV